MPNYCSFGLVTNSATVSSAVTVRHLEWQSLCCLSANIHKSWDQTNTNQRHLYNSVIVISGVCFCLAAPTFVGTLNPTFNQSSGGHSHKPGCNVSGYAAKWLVSCHTCALLSCLMEVCVQICVMVTRGAVFSIDEPLCLHGPFNKQ